MSQRELSTALAAAARRVDASRMGAVLAGGADATAVVFDAEDEEPSPSIAELGCAGSSTAANERTTAKRQLAALRLLAEHGGLSPAIASRALLRAASEPCGPAVVQYLLDAGGDARYAKAGGYTALHDVKRGDVARLLVAAGADANAATSGGDRPLHFCVYAIEDAEAVAAVLAEPAADVNAVNNAGCTPLISAAHGAGSPRDAAALTLLMPVLLGAGADPTFHQHSDDGRHCVTALDVVQSKRGRACRGQLGFREQVTHWGAIAQVLAS